MLSARNAAELVSRDRLVERLATLVKARSENPPGQEKQAALAVSEMCREAGLEVELAGPDPERPSVLARWSAGSGPHVTFCSHIDVVPAGDPGLWAVDPFAATVQDGVMVGRGTADAKGCCAAAIEAVEVLRAAGNGFSGTLELALVADEETMGFQGAGALVEQGRLRPDVAVVGEPTSLRVVRAQRGAAWLRITTHGRAAHGSAPERGRSAIKAMAAIVRALEQTLPEHTHDLLGGTTLNVGTISGGEKVNIVPAHCTIEVDRRTIPGETEDDVRADIDAALDLARAEVEDLEAEVDLAFYAAPFEVPREAAVVQAGLDAAQEVIGRAEVMGFRGASDARFLADTGADVIVLGPGDIAVAHTANESLDLDELIAGASVYALTFASLLGAR